MLIAPCGAIAGQAVVWYTGQFYALFFLEKTMKLDGASANVMIAVALFGPAVPGGGRAADAGRRRSAAT